MSKQLQDAYIVAATRTPIGKAPRGMFRNVRPDDLLVAAIRSAVSQVPGLDPKLIEDAIVGCSFPEGESGLNMARNAVLLAGLPNTVAGVTINRFCASGVTAIAMAADRIRVGAADVMIAGGAESMSMVPMGGFHPSINMNVFADENVGMAYGMGLTAEKVANQWKVTREMQDQFALRSHRKAWEATQTGRFKNEIVGIEGHDANGFRVLCDVDEVIRADATLEALAALAPAFDPKGGTVTAGSSSAISDGASAMLVMSYERAKAAGLKPRAKIVSMAVAGCDPAIMGYGPVPATKKALKRAGLEIKNIEVAELNEAFAAQSLPVIKDLGLMERMDETVNLNGGAIALGHPLGCSGARITTALLNTMEQKGATLGLATMCIGLGQGITTVLERA